MYRFTLIALVGAVIAAIIAASTLIIKESQKQIEYCPMGMTVAEMRDAHGPHAIADFKPLGLLQQDPNNPQPDPQPDLPDDERPLQQEPPHTEPTEFCTPHNRPDGKEPCLCLRQHPEGCLKGQREVEHRSCNSWCWKAKCLCCST